SGKTANFCFILFVVFYIILYGTYGLQYESPHYSPFDWSLWPTSPYIFTHQMVPRSSWKLVDITVCFDLLLVVSIAIVSLVHRNVDNKLRQESPQDAHSLARACA